MITERPLLTATFATDQPVGRGRRHGTIDADGTDWACSQSGSRWAQSRLWISSEVLTAAWLSKMYVGFRAARTSRARMAAHSPTRRALQRWIRIGRGGLGSSRMNSACRSRPWALSRWRSWEGMARPRAAANPSVISSTENWRRARW